MLGVIFKRLLKKLVSAAFMLIAHEAEELMIKGKKKIESKINEM